MASSDMPTAIDAVFDVRPERSVVDQIAANLGAAIVRGAYEEGDPLPTEPELAAEYGAGRNAVREAVRTLVSKGMLRTERRAGTIVQPRANWSMLDGDVMNWMLGNDGTRAVLLQELTELRAVIEPAVAAMAARKATTTDILRIFEAYEDMERHAHDFLPAIEADIRFHRRLFDAAHNLLLSNYSKAIFALLKANFEISIKADCAFLRNLADHKAIAEAVNARDGDAAHAATLELLRKNAADLKTMEEQSGGE